uniref:Cysteine-rich venom protein 7 n=1 Tax=Pimpla hypochondriaca TaxID=135724 RepID=CVP7_PIMHY|nr:RecName: Full=Cysteine-rich venom protein 7; Short=cvp7; Flags: Precursor [Pimpla hypochondriaca]CAD31108.1 cysteine-rich venom protein 7 [Pimpla hypochondriaca]
MSKVFVIILVALMVAISIASAHRPPPNPRCLPGHSKCKYEPKKNSCCLGFQCTERNQCELVYPGHHGKPCGKDNLLGCILPPPTFKPRPCGKYNLKGCKPIRPRPHPHH